MDKPSVTTVIYHRINRERIQEYRDWQSRITDVCKSYEGYQDTLLFEPGIVTHNESEFVTIFRFKSQELLSKWIESDSRKKLLLESESFTIGRTKIAFFNGLESWFSQENSPPRYKMTIVTFFAIWPLVHFLPDPINQILEFGPLGNEIVVVLIITITMSYVALPLACRIFNFWLKPK